MSQVMNILRKDVRRLWLEILLVLGGTAAFVWVSGRPWPLIENGSSEWRGSPLYGMQDQVWLPLLWWLLIARVAHQENLVSDRKFWTTRPYSWKSLVAEKALFIMLFVVAPGTLADCVLLHIAGFSPWSYAPQMLGRQGMIILLLLLPALATAAVTRNLWQFAVAGLCFFAFWILVIRPQPEAVVWFRFAFILAIGIAAALAATFLQYARRRTAVARGLMIAAVAAAVIVSVTPPPDALVFLRYPAGQTAITLAFDPAPARKETATYEPLSDEIPLNFPLQMEGVPDGDKIIADGVKLHIEAPEGKVWDSAWQIDYLWHTGSRASIGASVDRNYFDALKWVPLKARVTIAMAMMETRNESRFTVSRVPFVIPDVGHCSYGTLLGDPNLKYLAPFRSPFPSIMRVVKFGPDCITASGKTPSDWRDQIEDRLIPAFEFNIGAQPSYLENIRLDPVAAGWINFPFSTYVGFKWSAQGKACPGTEMVIMVLRPVRRLRREVEISGIRLADYAPRNAR
jgi:hypothetical protein